MPRNCDMLLLIHDIISNDIRINSKIRFCSLPDKRDNRDRNCYVFKRLAISEILSGLYLQQDGPAAARDR